MDSPPKVRKFQSAGEYTAGGVTTDHGRFSTRKLWPFALYPKPGRPFGFGTVLLMYSSRTYFSAGCLDLEKRTQTENIPIEPDPVNAGEGI